MKYIALTIAALFLMGGCSSADKKTANQPAGTQLQDNIIDEEFDLLVAPEYDYEKDVPYSEQIKNTADAKTKTVKPSKKPAAVKK